MIYHITRANQPNFSPSCSCWNDSTLVVDFMLVVSPSVRFCQYVCERWLNTWSLIVLSIHREEFSKRPAAVCLSVRWHWPTVICLNMHTSTNNVPVSCTCLESSIRSFYFPKSTHLMAVMLSLVFCYASLCGVLLLRRASVPFWRVVLHANILYSYHVKLPTDVDVFWNKLF